MPGGNTTKTCMLQSVHWRLMSVNTHTSSLVLARFICWCRRENLPKMVTKNGVRIPPSLMRNVGCASNCGLNLFPNLFNKLLLLWK